MKSGRFWWILLMILAAIAILVLGAQYYISSMRQALWMQSVREILEVTSQSSHSYNIYFRKEADLLANLADALSKSTPGGVHIIRNLLPDPQKNTTYIIVDLKNDLAYVNKLEKSRKLTEGQQNFLNRLAQKGLNGPYISSFTGQRFIGSYQRFRFADGSRGIVLFGQLASTIASEFPLSFYDNSGFSYVVDKEGDILIRSQHQNSNWTFHNLFEVLERDGNSPAAIKAFHQNLLDGRRGVASFRLGEDEFVFAFVPIAGDSDWYLVSIVPNSVITAYSNSAVRASEMFSFFLGLAAFILAAFLLFFIQHRRKVREQDSEIRYRKQLFNILVNNTNDVFLMLDSATRAVNYVSPNIERVLGIKPENAGEHLGLLQLPGIGEDASWPPPHLAAMRPGTTLKDEGELENFATGARRWFAKTVYSEIIENYARFIIVLSDRTKERDSQAALEEALARVKEANAAKSMFLSNMSHDIRTPMNAIVGLATLLRRDAENSQKVLEYTGKIAASSQYLLGLINNVLDMSKIESGKMQVAIGEVNLAGLIGELETVICPQAREKQQVFQITTKHLFHEKLLGDHLRINQVLINLLSNSVKYTANGGHVQMRIRQRVLPDGVTARMSFLVCDNGIGMTREYMAKIFESFTREHESITNTVQGTGLGMAITRELVDLMGGNIIVRSEKGRGTAFLVHLDLKIVPREDDGFWQKAGLERVLLLFDDENEARRASETIENSGIECLWARTAEQAGAMLEEAAAANEAIKLVLLNSSPPCSALNALGGVIDKMPQRPLLALASYDVNDVSDCDADAYINLPIFMANLRKLVEDARAPKAAEKPAKEKEKNFKGKKVLIVDDNEMNSDILGEILSMLEIESDVACNGQEALEKLNEMAPETYDAVLMDVQMPVMNGHEATRAFRASNHPRAKTMPVVAMTANTFEEDVRAAHDAGMDAHVAKPVDVNLLKQALEDLLLGEGNIHD